MSARRDWQSRRPLSTLRTHALYTLQLYTLHSTLYTPKENSNPCGGTIVIVIRIVQLANARSAITRIDFKVLRSVFTNQPVLQHACVTSHHVHQTIRSHFLNTHAGRLSSYSFTKSADLRENNLEKYTEI